MKLNKFYEHIFLTLISLSLSQASIVWLTMLLKARLGL